MENTKLDILKGYITQGWPLISLYNLTAEGCSCYKGTTCPVKNQGKHPRNEWRNPENQVTTWDGVQHTWGTTEFNVGMPTGEISNLVVIDVDGEQGKRSLEKLIQDTGQDLMLTRVHTTGSGGYHLFFEYPQGLLITNSNKNLKARYPGIDIRGEGGYVVMPPSQNSKGDYKVHNQNPVLRLSQSVLDVILTPYQLESQDGREVRHTTRDKVKDRTELPIEIQRECDIYADFVVTQELQRFETEYDQPGWDDLVNTVAFNVFLVANSPWNELDVEDIYDRIYDAAPRGGDGDWTEARIDKCVRSAQNAVLGKDKVRDMPPQQKEALEAYESVSDPKSLLRERLDNSQVNWEEAFAFDPESVEYLPGGFAREGDYITIIGDGKVGKSVFCHDWAWRMATGQAFLGKAMPGPIPVLYLDRENALQTYVDHFRSYGATPTTMGSLDFRTFPVMDALDTVTGGKTFVELVKSSGAKVVFIDTISRFIEGEENDNNTWLKVYRNCIVPLREYDPSITVIRIDHFGKDKAKGGRGGSAKTQDVDGVYEMKKIKDGSFVLERTHTRSGIGPETVSFSRTGRALEKMWAPGETSHVVAPAWSIPKGAKSQIDRTSIDAMTEFLDDQCIPDGPQGWGQRRIEELLRENDFKGTSVVLRGVQTARKAREDWEMVCDGTCGQ